jgi:phage terminase large subunit GpA-like protein
MEDFADPEVNEITVICSAQSAKTLTLLALLAWLIAEDPGPVLWVTAKLGEAKKISKGRVLPLLERCAPVAEKIPTSRMFKTTLEIYFPGAPLFLTGSESPA